MTPPPLALTLSSVSRTAALPNAAIDRTREGDHVATVVGEGERSTDQAGALSVVQVAERLGISASSVKRQARALGGARDARGHWQFSPVTVERRVTTQTQRVTIGRSREVVEPDVGRRTAAVVRMLESGSTCSAIVVALEEPYDFVARVRAQWISGYEADCEGLAFTCGCGSPSHSSTARCLRCHARSRVLSDAQQAVLAGADLPEPRTCSCLGCGVVVRVEDADSLCTACAPKLVITERGGVLVVMLAGRVVRELSVAETRALVPHLAHHLAAKETS